MAVRNLKPKAEQEVRVDTIDVSADKAPCSLFERVEEAKATLPSKSVAITQYVGELEALVEKYRKNSIEELIEYAHTSVCIYNVDLERALSLSKRIAFLKNA